MGSSSSKDAAAAASSSSSSSSRVRRNRSMGARVFQSSCLGGTSGSCKRDSDDHNKENWSYNHGTTCTDQNRTESDQVKHECCRKVNVEQQSDEVPCVSSNVELDEWGQESVTGSVSIADNSSSQAASTRSLFSSSRLRSRFSFIRGNISFRLSRATSLGSSRACSLFSSGLTISNAEERFHVHSGPTNGSVNRNEIHQGSELLPVCDVNGLPASQYEDTSSDTLQLDPAASRPLVHLQNHETVSTQDISRNNGNTGIPSDVNRNSPRNNAEIESIETRRPNRRLGAQEPVERSVRFSRTLSVGRLRDRVLRRSSFSDGLFGRLQVDREVRDSSHDNGRQVWGGFARTPATDINAEISPASSSYPPSSLSNSLNNNQSEISRPREARYHDIMEHRADFLERRRIRSQVRALQRLGSRFENLSGHERSCILSGQHRTGRCTCRANNQARNPDDDTSARASISRIVMLAEALFEVLDEIHQQSVVLSSRPSVSSIGSVPAPKEVVESMPVKIYMKLQKHQNEDASQCYICLVEYEEGDCMRILPCHHEFHRTCIDKWLKEIHRVCPLCRGDVCRSDSLPAED